MSEVSGAMRAGRARELFAPVGAAIPRFFD
jgi:hypothetical protein